MKPLLPPLLLRLAGAVFLLGICAILPSPFPTASPLAAPVSAASSTENSAEKLERLRAQIRREKAALSGILQKKGVVLEKLSALSDKLRKTRRRLLDLQKEREILAVEARGLEENSRLLALEVEKRRRFLAKRLRVRYRFGQVGFLRVMFGAENLADLSRRRKNLEALFRADRKQLTDYALLLAEWSRAREELSAKQKTLAEFALVLQEQEAELKDDEARVQEILRAIREEEGTRRQFLAELEADARRLSGVIAGLDRNPQRPAKHTETLPEDPLPEEAIPREEEGAFAQRRGRLCYPVSGPVVVPFGKREHPRFHTMTMHNGIEIGAAAGAPVRAVAEGEVRFAQWFQGYGNVVILEHDDGYYSVYGHLSEILVGNGQDVVARQTIGRVGDTGSLEGPSLYFELRHHQTPLNPQAWLGGC